MSQDSLDDLVEAVLGGIIGMAPEGGQTTCLSCGTRVDYGIEGCGSCGEPFAERPPFMHPNHLSQVIDALERFKDGRMTRPALVARVARWRLAVDEIDATWAFASPLAPRLADDDVAESLITLDQGLALLFSNLARLQAICGPSDRPAAPAEGALTDRIAADLVEFFRAACSACATITHLRGLRAPAASDLGPGSFFDLSVS